MIGSGGASSIRPRCCDVNGRREGRAAACVREHRWDRHEREARREPFSDDDDDDRGIISADDGGTGTGTGTGTRRQPRVGSCTGFREGRRAPRSTAAAKATEAGAVACWSRPR